MVSKARLDLPLPERPVIHQLVPGDFNVNVFQIVLSCTFYENAVLHALNLCNNICRNSPGKRDKIPRSKLYLLSDPAGADKDGFK